MATMAIWPKARMRSQPQPRDYSSAAGRNIIKTGAAQTKKRMSEGIGMCEEPGKKGWEEGGVGRGRASRERGMAKRVQKRRGEAWLRPERPTVRKEPPPHLAQPWPRAFSATP